MIRRLANFHDPASLASRMRARRFAVFRALLERLPCGATILDVGGTPQFWGAMDIVQRGRVRVTLLNLEEYDSVSDRVELRIGDARDMRDIPANAFDVVFSNSVIEHVGDHADQARMAAEIQRVGRRYFVQTPNRHFPIEPHFLLPMFQFYPRSVRVALVRRFQLGWMPRREAYADACREVDQIQLLTAGEMQRLFPDARIYRERIGGLTKSIVAYGGWGEDA